MVGSIEGSVSCGLSYECCACQSFSFRHAKGGLMAITLGQTTENIVKH